MNIIKTNGREAKDDMDNRNADSAGHSNVKHTVLIEDRSRIKINCVDDVESFNEEKVVVFTSLGVMVVTGFDFKVSRLSVEDGQLVIEGEIDRVEYMEERKDSRDEAGGFLGRLFR